VRASELKTIEPSASENTACVDCVATPHDSQGKGVFYAILAAIACPCHLPIVGVFLGGTAAGAFFYQNFWVIAGVMLVITLLAFYKAARILL
jgi:uncharacterized membrane protein